MTLNLTCVCKISSDALNIYNPRSRLEPRPGNLWKMLNGYWISALGLKEKVKATLKTSHPNIYRHTHTMLSDSFSLLSGQEQLQQH